MHVARARSTVAKEGEAHRRVPQPALRIGHSEDGAAHRPEMADHRNRAMPWIAVVNIALPSPGRAAGIRKILVQVLAQVPAPDQPCSITIGSSPKT